jgi:hypothetical protein
MVQRLTRSFRKLNQKGLSRFKVLHRLQLLSFAEVFQDRLKL